MNKNRAEFFIIQEESAINDLHRLHGYKTVSVSPENMTEEAGKGGATPLVRGTARSAARDLGTGWKVDPFMKIPAGNTLTLVASRMRRSRFGVQLLLDDALSDGVQDHAGKQDRVGNNDILSDNIPAGQAFLPPSEARHG